MARPMKERRVCCLPETDLFGPLNRRAFNDVEILMSVEEYETIRLIDKEGLMQEECAERMDVARTTVQRIYINARKKIADAIVDGKILKIEGGTYKLCEDDCDREYFYCGRGHGQRQFRNRRKRFGENNDK
ncbi:MAG: DUF134 domain-containing protein [Candidatus Methanofastidiosa archaeon]|nr:DUF134 domain-containing protein [Candidatus Methanofastidiosa archaeon]